MIDHAGEVSPAEAVVDIHDGDAAGAGVEHAQERRDPAETRPVAHARGHGDDRAVGKAADHARQRALHARDGHDAPGGHDRLHVAEQPVDAGYSSSIWSCKIQI